jgi:phospholipid/cholesterol/gamma-HCH transport system substrate-binding protein
MARRRRSLSFLERNQRIVGSIALFLVLVGTVLGLLLQGGLLTPTYRVTAMFTDAAGVRAGDRVTVAGLEAGTVKDVEIRDGMVAMELGVEEGTELPADSRAEVVVETLLGRQSVALVPGSSEALLADGDVIPPDRTTTPVDITELNDISVELLDASDADALETFMDEVTKVTGDSVEEIQALIAGLEDVTAAVDSRSRELAGLIESLHTLARTFGQRDQRIVSLIDNLNVVLGNLAERQEELETLLVATEGSSNETADLVERNRVLLDSTLVALHSDLQVLNRHQLDLAAGIAYLRQAVQGYSSVGYSQNTPNRWANIFVQQLGPLGVDALVGKCGLVDKLFDHYFDADCEDSTTPPPTASVTTRDARPASGLAAPEAPPAVGLPALPCSIGDVVDRALTGVAAEPAGTGRCGS